MQIKEDWLKIIALVVKQNRLKEMLFAVFSSIIIGTN